MMVYSIVFWVSLVIVMLLNIYIIKTPFIELRIKEETITSVAIAYLIFACLLPMNLSPIYNGEQKNQRQQYEKTAEAFSEGHLYLDLEVDPGLLAMDNPYDRQARDDAGVQFEYDTAFFKGHYYMYFGVTPVILVYLPYLLITGHSLVGYKGTQLIVAFLIIGFFVLFKKIAKIFFMELKFGSYILLSSTASIISVWYAVSAPSLYTVPNVMGICMMLYSYYFYLKAVYDECSDNKAIICAVIGALFGSLAFGCRPTIAFGNIFAIPLVVNFFKRRTFSWTLLLKLIFVMIPYAVTGSLLMIYNYLRFDNPFEFGQSYQLTTEDQSKYMSMLSRFDLKAEIHGLVHYFLLSSRNINLLELGAFVSFPVLLFIIYVLFNKKVVVKMHIDGMMVNYITLIIIPVLIAAMDVLWSPYFWPRYRMDIYWILCIAAFIAIGYCIKLYPKSKLLMGLVTVMCDVSILMSFLMCLYPFDHNFTFHYNLSVVDVIKDLVTFRIL